MKAKVLLAAFLIFVCSVSTAFADVADPGRPYRPPRRPLPPIEQPVRQTNPTVDIAISEAEENGGTLLFNFGFPDIGTYEYRVYDQKTGEPVHGTAGAYNDPGPGTVTVEFPYVAPEEGDGALYRLTVHFAVVRREPTSFGQKIGDQPDEQDIEREILIERKDGRTQIFISQDGAWKAIG